MVASTRLQIPPLLLIGAHTSEVDLGAWFVEVDSLQGLPRSFHRRRLFPLLGDNVTAEVAVDELEGVRRVILGRLLEWKPPLLPGQAAVTQLPCMLDVGQHSDHLLQPTEHIETEVAEPGMPRPWLLGVPRRQAHRLLHLQIE